uniref:EGF-like domain-containing protein n=1 Tax=Chromera velia CCMP2878 TaxID=1169474 RepID=A0A0G4FCD6_9ALVE|eukprot:Cvel_16319.t1-p1 / transcript=Cvel_16319.t1 / gene=Cvel_16319 / organism=Chromera_velia_CCMP2878 / gene_product=hypothetical protein / transcript_product=hypothetical protein / location=Cvel_scaffold1252:25408-32768(-) / protein_length=1455 / sequence_SO=supercontig / SO=protein_coding / is_pseudo=false
MGISFEEMTLLQSLCVGDEMQCRLACFWTERAGIIRLPFRFWQVLQENRLARLLQGGGGQSEGDRQRENLVNCVKTDWTSPWGMHWGDVLEISSGPSVQFSALLGGVADLPSVKSVTVVNADRPRLMEVAQQIEGGQYPYAVTNSTVLGYDTSFLSSPSDIVPESHDSVLLLGALSFVFAEGMETLRSIVRGLRAGGLLVLCERWYDHKAHPSPLTGEALTSFPVQASLTLLLRFLSKFQSIEQHFLIDGQSKEKSEGGEIEHRSESGRGSSICFAGRLLPLPAVSSEELQREAEWVEKKKQKKRERFRKSWDLQVPSVDEMPPESEKGFFSPTSAQAEAENRGGEKGGGSCSSPPSTCSAATAGSAKEAPSEGCQCGGGDGKSTVEGVGGEREKDPADTAVAAASKVLQTSRSGFVNIVLFDSNFLWLTFSFLCNLEKLGGALESTLFVALDAESFSNFPSVPGKIHKVLWQPENAVWTRGVGVSGGASSKEGGGSLTYGDVGFFGLMAERLWLLQRLVKAQIPFLFAESDAVWARNFLTELAEAKKGGEEWDIAASVDPEKGWYAPGFHAVIRPSPAVERMYAWVRGRALHDLDLRLKLLKEGTDGKGKGPRAIAHLGNEAAYFSAYVDSNRLRVLQLPPALYPSGLWYDRPEMRCRDTPPPVVIQNNYLESGMAKELRARTFGHWFVTDQGVCAHNDPYEIHARASGLTCSRTETGRDICEAQQAEERQAQRVPFLVVSGYSQQDLRSAEEFFVSLRLFEKKVPVKFIVLDSSPCIWMDEQTSCSRFDFASFPPHVRDVSLRAWVPLVLLSLLKEAEVVWFLDAGVRLLSSEPVSALIQHVSSTGFSAYAAARSSRPEPEKQEKVRTRVVQWLHSRGLSSGFVGLGIEEENQFQLVSGDILALDVRQPEIVESILTPLAACALDPLCVAGREEEGRGDEKSHPPGGTAQDTLLSFLVARMMRAHPLSLPASSSLLGDAERSGLCPQFHSAGAYEFFPPDGVLAHRTLEVFRPSKLNSSSHTDGQAIEGGEAQGGRGTVRGSNWGGVEEATVDAGGQLEESESVMVKGAEGEEKQIEWTLSAELFRREGAPVEGPVSVLRQQAKGAASSVVTLRGEEGGADALLRCDPDCQEGVCFLGKCHCLPGFGGPACEHPSLESFHGPCHGSSDACLQHPLWGRMAVPPSRWRRAQDEEGEVWRQAPDTDLDDRGEDHLWGFDNYRDLPTVLGDYAEVGCGPWTQLRVLLEARSELTGGVRSATLVDPSALVYARDVPTCAYRTGRLERMPSRQRNATAIPVHDPDEQQQGGAGTKGRRQGGSGDDSNFFPFPVTVVNAGGEHLVNARESFDTVVLINVIEHVQNGYALLENLYRSLRPGGILIFNDRYYDDMPPDYWSDLDSRLHPIRPFRAVYERFFSFFEPIFVRRYSIPNILRGLGRCRAPLHRTEGFYFIGRKL